MATATNYLKIVGTYDWEGKRDVKAAEDDLGGMGKKVGMLAGIWGGIATAAIDALAQIGGAVLEVGAQIVELGSDAEEMESKFAAVFANVGGDVAADMDNFAEAVGRSKLELKGYAAEIGDTLQPMGFAEDRAGELSGTLVKLATDLSSFNNMSMDEALQRLQGTLIGSHENALKFGVVINENTLKAEMMRNGWDKLAGAQLEQAKVQARINLLIQGTTAAQGDALRTSDGWANQTRRLQAVLSDAGAAMGQEILPVLTPIVTQMADLAVKGTPTLVAAMKEFAAIMEDVGVVVTFFSEKMGQIDPKITKFAGKTVLMTTGLAPVVNILKSARDGLGWMADAVQETTNEMDDISQSAEDGTAAISEMAQETYGLAVASQETIAVLMDLGDVTKENTSYYEDEMWAMEESNAQRDEAIQKAKDHKKALEEHAEAQAQMLVDMENVRLKFDEGQEAIGGYFAAALQAGGETKSFGEMLFTAGQNAGLAATDMVILAAATGDYSDEAIAAALKQALMQEELGRLMEEVRNGNMTIHEAIGAAQDYQASLENMVHPLEEVRDQQEAVNTLMSEMQGEYNASFNLNVNGLDAMEAAAATADRLNNSQRGFLNGGEGDGGSTTNNNVNTTNSGGNTVNIFGAGEDDLNAALRANGVIGG